MTTISDEPLARLTYSVPEAAELLGVSRASAYNYVRSGEIPSLTLGGRIVIPRRAIAQLLGIEDGQAA